VPVRVQDAGTLTGLALDIERTHFLTAGHRFHAMDSGGARALGI